MAASIYINKAANELGDNGYTAIKTNDGPWDLIAFRGDELVRCIQIKRTKAPGGVKQLLGKFQAEEGINDGQKWRSEMWVWYKGEWHKSDS